MKAYKFRIHVEEDDSFLRDFELTENQSLMDFHNILTKNLNLNEEELASFFLTTENWEKEEEVHELSRAHFLFRLPFKKKGGSLYMI